MPYAPYQSTWNNTYLPANGKPYEDVMKVIDEHLETIKLLYPKTWEGIIQRIKEL